MNGKDINTFFSRAPVVFDFVCQSSWKSPDILFLKPHKGIHSCKTFSYIPTNWFSFTTISLTSFCHWHLSKDKFYIYTQLYVIYESNMWEHTHISIFITTLIQLLWLYYNKAKKAEDSQGLSWAEGVMWKEKCGIKNL